MQAQGWGYTAAECNDSACDSDSASKRTMRQQRVNIPKTICLQIKHRSGLMIMNEGSEYRTQKRVYWTNGVPLSLPR